MKFFRMLKCDLYLSVCRQWKYLLVLLTGMVLFCLDFHFRTHQAMEPLIIPDMQDYLFFIFGGMGQYSPSPEEPFLFPGIWICCIGYLLFLLLRYPREDFYEMGQQIVIRSGSRISYWVSKCVMLISEVLIYTLLCYGTVFIFTVVTGGTVFQSLNTEWLEGFGRVQLTEQAAGGVPFWLYLLPLAMILFLSSVQLVLSYVVGTTIAFLVTLLTLISSSYFMTPYLPGNWGMIYRSSFVMTDGINSGTLLGVSLIACLILLILGGTLFCRMDLLKREELG